MHVPSSRFLVVRFAGLALVVAACDLLTKQLAMAMLPGRDVPLGDLLRLVLVHNRGAAFGMSFGPYTWQLNIAFTVAAVVLAAFTCRALTAVDRSAPVALGLIAGGALGNLTSLLLPPAGVPDFIAVGPRSGFQLVFNLADVAAYAGVALGGRLALSLVRAWRPPAPAAPAARPGRALAAEVAVAIPGSAEPAYAARRAADAPVVPVLRQGRHERRDPEAERPDTDGGAGEARA